jgi:large subunit ribosomal protein L13
MTNKIERKLHRVDAEGQSVGRIASQIAILLRGKNKTSFVPHIDAGDIVEVTNIDKLKFTGKKLDQKLYYRHSGYPSGLKTKKMGDMVEKNSPEILKRAVRDMLPPVKFRDAMLKRIIMR